MSNSEKDRLLNECQNSSWNKLYLIVLMAITTGARKGELERLKWSDIDFDRGLAYGHQTKNGEPRVLPLTQQVLTEMERVGREVELIFNSSI
ncbi:site-specific integrase, partial [Gammaproteobacteria bacterium]|nr:site-specific integrase [Gammaproteobacteria bacterium]